MAYPGRTRAANGSKCWNWFRGADHDRGGAFADCRHCLPVARTPGSPRIDLRCGCRGAAMALILGECYRMCSRPYGAHSACRSRRPRCRSACYRDEGGKGRARPSPALPTIVSTAMRSHGRGEQRQCHRGRCDWRGAPARDDAARQVRVDVLSANVYGCNGRTRVEQWRCTAGPRLERRHGAGQGRTPIPPARMRRRK